MSNGFVSVAGAVMLETNVILIFLFMFAPHVAFVILLARRKGARGGLWARAGWWLGIPPWIMLAGLAVTNATARAAATAMWTYVATVAISSIVVGFRWKATDGDRREREWRWALGLWLGTQLHLWVMMAVAPQSSLSAGGARLVANLGRIGRGLIARTPFHRALPYQYTVTEAGTPASSWRVTLLPFIGEEELFDRFVLEQPYDALANQAASRQLVGAYLNPINWQPPTSSLKLDLLFGGATLRSRDAKGYALTHFAGAAGPDAAFRPPGSTPVRLDRLKAARGSLLIAGETALADIPWAAARDVDVSARRPRDGADSFLGFSPSHTGGCHFLAADGSVRYILATVDPDVLADQFVVRMTSLREILLPHARRNGSSPAPSPED